MLNSITLAASAAGALVFGRMADILGRKRIYGYEVLIGAIGAIASAFAPNSTFLLISRAARGRSPFAGMVLGSVSQRCAAAATCPVVLVKALEP